MLDNTITLPVDVENNGTPVNQVYTRYDEYQNRSVYIGADHSLMKKNVVTFYRTPVKKSGGYLGTAKTAIKVTEDITVLSATGSEITAPIVADVDFSLPIGTTAEKAMEIRQRIIALVDHAIATRLTTTQEI